jgi:hypothetical protein
MASALAQKVAEDLDKALSHLEYSFKKAGLLLKQPSLSEDDLEALEGFGSRFARASDIAVQKLLKLKVLEKDPGFRGGVMDILNESEKFGWIASAREWARIRELRNVTAHEYSETEVRELYSEILRLSQIVLSARALLPA